MSVLKVKRLHPDAILPTRAKPGDSGLDLYALVTETTTLLRGDTRKVRTGVAVELPAGTEGQVRPRSSLSAKGVHVAFGTIDNGYRGELVVTITNLSDAYFLIRHGDRIAQLVVAPVLYPVPEEVEALSETERGAGGYGSTGK